MSGVTVMLHTIQKNCILLFSWHWFKSTCNITSSLVKSHFLHSVLLTLVSMYFYL